MDILAVLSHLASRVNAPTADDRKKFNHIFGYLKRFPDKKLTFHTSTGVSLNAYIDAKAGLN